MAKAQQFACLTLKGLISVPAGLKKHKKKRREIHINLHTQLHLFRCM